MRTTLLLTTFLAVATLSAQEQGPVPRPAVTPETTVVHYHGRPIIRILQNYTLPAGETVREVQTVFGDAIINGRVEHDVNVVMGSAYIGSTAVIEGTLAVFGGSAVI